MKFWIFGAALFMVVIHSTTATAADCSDLSGHEKDRPRTLYYYALLAEAADTGMLPRWACMPSGGDARGAPKIYKHGVTNRDWNNFADQPLPPCADETPPCIRRLTTAEFREGMYQWHDIVAEFRNSGRHVGVYESRNGGPAYVVCDNRTLGVMLFMELSEFRVPVDDGDLRPWIVRPIMWMVENTLIDEAIETVTLRKNNHLSDNAFPEQVTAIRGTRPDRLPQWRATVRQLLGDSCIFRLMARVSGHFAQENTWKYTVTGHSLGGAVAQYIAQHNAANNNDSRFRAFAFNAIGINVQVDPKILQSFYVKGDPVPATGVLIGNVQAGRSVRYSPQDTDEWRIRTPFDRLKRHMLSGVQKALCDCMNGKGTLIVTPEER